MRSDLLNLLQSPDGESLTYHNEGNNEFLEASSGEKFLITNGIIRFLDNDLITGNNKSYQKMYDRIAVFYDLAGKLYAILKEGGEEKRLREYLSLLNINEGDKVIEISIGTGRNIKYLNPNAIYFGVDISIGMLGQCFRKMKRIKREISLIQTEAESLPLKSNTFDVVFSAGGFNFFNDPGKALNEMLRIAKSGTKVLITDETERFRLKHTKNEFYNKIAIKDPRSFLNDSCINIEYKEICDGDLYVLTFFKQ